MKKLLLLASCMMLTAPAYAQRDFTMMHYEDAVVVEKQESCNTFMNENPQNAIRKDFNTIIDTYINLKADLIIEMQAEQGVSREAAMSQRTRDMSKHFDTRHADFLRNLHESQSAGFMVAHCNKLADRYERAIVDLKPDYEMKIENQDYCDHDGWDIRYGEGVEC